MKQFSKTLPSVKIQIDAKSKEMVDQKTKRTITETIDLIKYDCESLTEDELRAVFETLGLVEEENMNRLEHRVKNKINFDKYKFSGTKESLVLLNEVSNTIYEY